MATAIRCLIISLIAFPLMSCSESHNSSTTISCETKVYVFPLIFRYNVSVPEGYKEAIKNAAKKWNNLLGKEAIRIEPELVLNTPGQDSHSIIHYSKNWPDNHRQQANATIWWINQAINESDIKMNGQDYEFDTAGYEVDVESIFLHEFGHSLGLGHSGEPESVMFPTLERGKKRINFHQVDVEQVKCRYN